MSDANGFVVVAYVLTVVVLGAYAAVLLLRAWASERRLTAVREAQEAVEARARKARAALAHRGAPRAGDAVAVGASHPHLELERAGGSHVEA